MAANLARPSGRKNIPVKEAKDRVLDLIVKGATVSEAMSAVNRSEETYKSWRSTDEEFRAALIRIRDQQKTTKETGKDPVPDFETFARDWLKQPLFSHQQNLYDYLTNKTPRNLHESMNYKPSGKLWLPNQENAPAGRKICNIPPGHAKTTTISINWVTWLIHQNPNLKIIVVCKDQTLAMDILSAVKFRLTSPVFREMHQRFAPEGGWKDVDNTWSATRIRVQGKDDGEKDPTFQALGIGGRIYGARSDIIILDDAVTLANVNEHEKQGKWLQQEVESRLDGGGLLALLGTRIAPTDLYSQMRELTDWTGAPVFDYLSMPAILDEGSGVVDEWVPLWPEHFDPQRLTYIRRDESMWALVYQQQDVAEDATFNSKAVQASINKTRQPGPMTPVGMGHRPKGMDGLYVIGGLDPATVGNTAMVVTGLDPITQKRYVLDGRNIKGCTPQEMRDNVKTLTVMYGIREWYIERNAFQRFLTQDPELKLFLNTHGCQIREHYTTDNKYDADFGVSAMAALFETCGEPQKENRGGPWTPTPEKALIELPTTKNHAWVSELVNQLIVWQPSGMKQNTKTDLVMALWFAEIGVRKILDRNNIKRTHLPSQFMTQAQKQKQQVISLTDARERLQLERATAAYTAGGSG